MSEDILKFLCDEEGIEQESNKEEAEGHEYSKQNFK